jgi:alkylation response protein AidB-like acyl-CoA dehydrogenase
VGHYKSNVRDQVFNLFEVFGVDEALGQGKFADLDADTAKEMLGEMARLAEGPLADSFVEGDRNPPVFHPDTHSVTIPAAFKKSVKAFIDAGWDKVGLVEELGGMPAPKALVWALHEHVLGANPAVWMYAGGAGFSQIFWHLATEEQKKWAEIAAERGWGATMVLTEPDVPMWAPAAPRPSSRRMAPGTSTASSGSSPLPTPMTCSRTSCTWCWPARRAPDRAPRGCRCSSSPSSTSTR